MDRFEYRQKQKDAERKREESSKAYYRQQLVDAITGLAKQNKAAENQAQRADAFHRRVEALTLRLEGRKYWLELAETLGLWIAAGVGVAAILVASHDSDIQTSVMQKQLTAMQGQLNEMKGTGAQTDQMIEANRKLADAAGKQAQAAIENAKTAQDNMIASQRAWVGPRLAKSEKPPQLNTETSVVIEYQNTGREPARETIYDTVVFTITEDENNSGAAAARIISFIDKCKIKWTPTQAQVIFPTVGGLGGNAYSLTSAIEGSLIDQDVIEGKKRIIVSGCFVYKTVNTVRRRSFCYFFNAQKTPIGGWNICQVGNDAD